VPHCPSPRDSRRGRARHRNAGGPSGIPVSESPTPSAQAMLDQQVRNAQDGAQSPGATSANQARRAGDIAIALVASGMTLVVRERNGSRRTPLRQS
jgi:hypothetical protein